MSVLQYAVSDTLVLAERSLKRIPRQPDLLIGFTVQPVMFVLLFVYVFGGAIATPGLEYVDFLMPGIIVQSMVFGGFVTALGLADDLKKGLIDRFRSLPMWGPAVIAGRILADVGTNVIQLIIMFSVGFLAGFRFHASWREVVAGIGAPAADRLRVLVGVRVHRVERLVPGGLERLRLHDPLPDHVRLFGLRAGRFDAQLAAADRRAQSVHDHGGRSARAVRRHARGQRHLALDRLVTGDHRRLRDALGLALPPGGRTVN